MEIESIAWYDFSNKTATPSYKLRSNQVGPVRDIAFALSDAISLPSFGYSAWPSEWVLVLAQLVQRSVS